MKANVSFLRKIWYLMKINWFCIQHFSFPAAHTTSGDKSRMMKLLWSCRNHYAFKWETKNVEGQKSGECNLLFCNSVEVMYSKSYNEEIWLDEHNLSYSRGLVLTVCIFIFLNKDVTFTYGKLLFIAFLRFWLVFCSDPD